MTSSWRAHCFDSRIQRATSPLKPGRPFERVEKGHLCARRRGLEAETRAQATDAKRREGRSGGLSPPAANLERLGSRTSSRRGADRAASQRLSAPNERRQAKSSRYPHVPMNTIGSTTSGTSVSTLFRM